ncbi:MAG: DUF4397 domain-containing protein [Lachnospiraceae bacterium]|nr:DUF4397 domain-containing protein [Lachnospiraceae bacterium]
MAENDSNQTPSVSADNADNRTNENSGLTTPIAPEGGIPAFPGNMTSVPTTPPVLPDPNPPTPSLPSTPSFPSVPMFPSRPVFPSIPVIPSVPMIPSNPSLPIAPDIAYSQVRFINASTNTFPVNFSIDGIRYASNSQFGNVSGYQRISDGFHTVSVNRTAGMQALLLQQSFPFTAGQNYTMVLVDAREGGLEMVQVTDTGCNNLPSGYGCYRVANMSYSGSNFDIRMFNGDTIFRHVNFTQVTSYKRAMAGNYTFYAAAANFYSMIRELPVIIIGAVAGGDTVSAPLASANVTIRPGTRTTSYIIGNIWSAFSLRMITVNDD